MRSLHTPRRLQSASSLVPCCVWEIVREADPECVNDPAPSTSIGRSPNSDLNSISTDCPEDEQAVVPELAKVTSTVRIVERASSSTWDGEGACVWLWGGGGEKVCVRHG